MYKHKLISNLNTFLTPFSNGVVTTIGDSIWVIKLPEFYQKQAVVVGEAASLVKKYIGRDTMHGLEEYFLWKHDVPVSCLRYSRKVLAKHRCS